jgi:hypothetical protein
MNDIAVIVSSVVFAWGFIGLLAFIFYKDKQEREYIRKLQTDLTNLPTDLQKFHTEIMERDTARTYKLIGDSFKDFLRHIEKLERMTLPKPVTEKDVRSVLSRVGEVADESLEIANDIEQEQDKGVEMPADDWTGFIDNKTKVAFEGDNLPPIVTEGDGPTVIEE